MRTLIQRLGKYIRRNRDGCWLWTGSRNSHGQPIVGWKTETFKVRRVMVVLYRGEIEAGQMVSMTCGDKTCVNPEHMRMSNVGRAMTLRDLELGSCLPADVLPQEYVEP